MEPKEEFNIFERKLHSEPPSIRSSLWFRRSRQKCCRSSFDDHDDQNKRQCNQSGFAVHLALGVPKAKTGEADALGSNSGASPGSSVSHGRLGVRDQESRNASAAVLT